MCTQDSSLSFRMTCRESFPLICTQDSSLSFRMTGQGCFFFENPTNINPETISHISILKSQFYHYAGSFTTFRMTYREPRCTQDSSLRSEWQGRCVYFENPTNINPETISHISILKSQFYHYAGSFTAFRMTYREPRCTQDSSLSFRMTGQGCFFLKIQPTLIPNSISHLNTQIAILSLRGILHCVQDDIIMVILFFWIF